MKKFLVLFLGLSLAVSYTLVADEDEGIGLSAGLEFGIANIGKANDEEMTPYLMPMLIYGNSFLDDSLELYAELDYTFGFTKEPDDEGGEVFPQSLYFDFMLGYNFGLGDTSTLSVIIDEIIILPKFKEINALTGIFTPAVKFTQGFDFGDLFAQIGVPGTVQYDKDADTEVGLDFTLGWNSSFGLGIEAKIRTLLAPGDDRGYSGLETIVSYENDPIYLEVETIFPGEISGEGITITPEFDYIFRNFTFYVKCEFAGIGIDGGSVCVSPALGFKYSF
jgi:hypothetical protein